MRRLHLMPAIPPTLLMESNGYGGTISTFRPPHTLEPPQRLRLMRVTFQKFFPWVWIAVLLLLASGYAMVFIVFGGFAGAGLHVHLMQGIGWLISPCSCGYSTDRGWHSNAP